MRNSLTFCALILSAFFVAGCDHDGPTAKAGAKVDEAVTDVGNAVEDACEDVKDAVDAKDKDC